MLAESSGVELEDLIIIMLQTGDFAMLSLCTSHRVYDRHGAEE